MSSVFELGGGLAMINSVSLALYAFALAVVFYYQSQKRRIK